jgi:hypothetical protein
MSTEFDNTSNTVDSRDVLTRIEELTAERDALQEEYDESEGESEAERIAQNELDTFNNSDDGKELDILLKLQSVAEGSSDWIYGEQLINEDYFTQYIEELINDCYEMPKEMGSGNWPYRHITMNFEAAAEEAKQDYVEVDFDGNTFLIRA